MSKPWYPTKDADFLLFAQNWSAHATSTPTAYNFVAADATTLAALVTAYQTSLAAATDGATRTKATVAAKDIAKANLLNDLKLLKFKLQSANPAIAANKREELGLPGTAVKPSPVPAPSTEPVVSVTGSNNNAVSVRLADERTPTKKAKPPGVTGAEVFSFQGATPPTDLNEWTFEGLSTKNDFAVDFGVAAVPGTQVWICARWYNHKGETGPVSAAAGAYIAGGIAQAA